LLSLYFLEDLTFHSEQKVKKKELGDKFIKEISPVDEEVDGL
jgi:hypothetical protein